MRYVQLPRAAVDTQLLEDATRRGASLSSSLPSLVLLPCGELTLYSFVRAEAGKQR